jgi:hypothetical protein
MPHLDAEFADAVVQQGKGAPIERSDDYSSPGRNRVQNVAAIAPMPELNATAASPFSRLAMRDSSSARVGLEMRVE